MGVPVRLGEYQLLDAQLQQVRSAIADTLGFVARRSANRAFSEVSTFQRTDLERQNRSVSLMPGAVLKYAQLHALHP